MPLDHVTTMQALVSDSAGQPRFRTAVILTFSLLALFITSIGLYGVMSHVVSQRTQEFGIRMAVGASTGAVLRLVLSQAAKLVRLGMNRKEAQVFPSTEFVAMLLELAGGLPAILWNRRSV